MRLHRLIAVLLLLESRRQMKARELACALEVTERTIHRDIAALCEAGIPIQATAGPNGGFRLMEGYTSHLPQVPQEEAIGLFLRGIGMNLREQREAHVDLHRALGKLESQLPDCYRQDVRTAQKRFYFDPDPWWESVFFSMHLDVLRQAVWHSRKLAVTYENASLIKTSRILHPYGLVVKTMRWYMVAYCETRKAVRTFNVYRIYEAELLEETFAYPEDFSLEAYWKAGVNSFLSEAAEYEQNHNS